jgi:capsular polysaccharide biosynthesis protein
MGEEVLWITDYWSKGYFHWLTDALTRLLVVRDRMEQRTLMLPWKFETLQFVKPALDIFGVTNVDFIQPDEVVHCRSLVMPTHTAPSGHFKEDVIRGVRTKLLAACGDANYRGPGERIYISRRRAGRRRIANESELTPILDRFGFQTVCAEELSFEEQVKLASRARYLVSNHGAGLTNMLFMREGGSVLELRHRADWINNCYFILASALDLPYFYQLCEPQPEDGDPHTADLLVAPGQLEKNLTDLMAD